jgi:hypothetical protein
MGSIAGAFFAFDHAPPRSRGSMTSRATLRPRAGVIRFHRAMSRTALDFGHLFFTRPRVGRLDPFHAQLIARSEKAISHVDETLPPTGAFSFSRSHSNS